MTVSPSDRPKGEAAARDGARGFEGLTIELSIEDEAWLQDGLGDIDELLRRCLAATAARLGLPEDVRTELSATFTSDAEVKALNAQWRGKDQPTNVLSFPIADLEPGDMPGPVLGDVILARETVLREAEAEGKDVRDHVCHLVVHGIMHCLGFDHVEPAGAESMERLETAILQDLGIADPYAMIEAEGDAASQRLAS